MMTEERKTYRANFKSEAVRLVAKQGYSMSKAARRLDVNVNMLRRWKQQLEEQDSNAFPGKGRLLPEQEELRRLHEEIQRLRMERGMLKKRSLFLPTSRLRIRVYV
jgi:transposase